MGDDPRDERTLRRLRRVLAEDVLADDFTPADVDDELRADGADPVRIGRRFAALVKTHLEERHRLAWQAEARADLERARQAILQMRSQPKPRNKVEALEVLGRLRTDARTGGVISAAFRKKSPQQTSEEELIALIDDLHKLLALSENEDPEKP